MLRRAIIIFALIFLPAIATADDTAPTPANPGTASSTGLGPETVSPSAGGSNADAGALQPAGNQPLQSTTGDSAGLTAPANALQGAAPSDGDLQVLAGEGDGAPVKPGETATSDWVWFGLTGLIVLIITGVVIFDRRRFARAERHAHQAHAPEH